MARQSLILRLTPLCPPLATLPSAQPPSSGSRSARRQLQRLLLLRAPLALSIAALLSPSINALFLRLVSAPTGIGFKACFTIAGQIFISSNGFSFMLDKEGLLLVPIWVEPPNFPGGPGEPGGGGGTAMYLQYLPSVNAAQAFKQIDKLNAGTLCFLRKLR